MELEPEHLWVAHEHRDDEDQFAGLFRIPKAFEEHIVAQYSRGDSAVLSHDFRGPFDDGGEWLHEMAVSPLPPDAFPGVEEHFYHVTHVLRRERVQEEGEN